MNIGDYLILSMVVINLAINALLIIGKKETTATNAFFGWLCVLFVYLVKIGGL